MSEPTISDLNAAFSELNHWGRPIVNAWKNNCVLTVRDIKICPGFTGEVRGEGATLSAAIYDALEQLRVARATVPPIPRDMPVALKGEGNE
jgi:hypothetical protein